MSDLSIQIHPDDDFARQYNGGRGKPEARVILDTSEDGQIEFGIKVTRYWDEPGLYTLIRLQLEEKGKFLHAVLNYTLILFFSYTERLQLATPPTKSKSTPVYAQQSHSQQHIVFHQRR